MNRVGPGLAIGAGYVLGRTKKMKLTFAVGTLAAGRRMQPGPRALVDLVTPQPANHPQFKEIGDQLREDLRGVGKAASGAMAERRLDALADRLHGRTEPVRDQLAGVVTDEPDLDFERNGEPAEPAELDDPERAEEAEGAEDAGDAEDAEDHDEEEPEPRRNEAALKAPGKKAPHSLADTLTRVLLVIEYYPEGLFEKTGNLWHTQGRLARLDLKGETEEGG
ncbi:SRPBCC family protein [Streptomyces blattellae]|uniref:DNA primase n=1 Tax=Streptomyces blattellae TaxID=2569855 RepID=UPI0018AC9445|nr:DNA primase [Streptomyces blattellae]